jgi:serine phosphatase RsbU (regulator of sigma subunit)
MTTIKVEERIAFIKAEVAAATSVEEMCERVGHILVPTFVHGCLIALTEPTGDLSSVVINHEDDDRQRFLELAASDPQDELALRPAIEQGAEKSGVALIGGRTAFFHTAPLNFADQSVGAISLVDTLTGVPFEEKGAAVIADIGRKLAVAILNRRLTSRLLDTNHQLQRGLRPSVLPDVDGWEFAAEYLPAGKGSEVGGDFYDLFETPTGWVAVMGDVTGHGPIAARLTAVSRFGLRAVAELTGDLVEAVRQLNRMLIAEPELSLVTLTCVQFASPKPGGDVPVTVLRCGHPPPLLLTDGGVRSLGNIGPMLGALPDVDWTPEVVKVKHGETLVLYTDGVTDVKGRSGRFGEQRLLETLARNGGSAEETVAALVEELDRFRAGERTDDQAVMALCVEPCEPTFDADVVRVAEA